MERRDVASLIALLQLTGKERRVAIELRDAVHELKAALRDAPPPVLAMLAADGAPIPLVLQRLDQLLDLLPLEEERR